MVSIVRSDKTEKRGLVKMDDLLCSRKAGFSIDLKLNGSHK